MSPREVTPEERDAARRMMDVVNLHVHARLAAGGDAPPGYVAIRLADGRSPDGNTFYDSRRDLFRHHPHDTDIFAVKVGMETMAEDEALIVLSMNRMARSRGVIFREEEVVVPHLAELSAPYVPAAFRNLQKKIGGQTNG